MLFYRSVRSERHLLQPSERLVPQQHQQQLGRIGVGGGACEEPVAQTRALRVRRRRRANTAAYTRGAARLRGARQRRARRWRALAGASSFSPCSHIIARSSHTYLLFRTALTFSSPSRRPVFAIHVVLNLVHTYHHMGARSRGVLCRADVCNRWGSGFWMEDGVYSIIIISVHSWRSFRDQR